MSRMHRREVGFCPFGGKVAFRSAAKAKQAILRHRQPHPPLYHYQCQNCGLWHLTSVAPQRGAA